MEKVSLGVRLNNPCNIRYNGIQWKGLTFPQSSCGFCVFKDPVYGVRAFLIILRTYVTKHNIKNVRQFVNRYAPAGDGKNNPDKYCAFILDIWRRRAYFDVADRSDVFDKSWFYFNLDYFHDKAFLLYVFAAAVAEIESGFVLPLYLFRDAYKMI